MKCLISMIVALVVGINCYGRGVKEYFKAGNPIVFAETEYKLAWSINHHDDHFLQEYLPEGESFERFNQMITISICPTDIDPSDAIAAKAVELDIRKSQDPTITYAVFNGDDEKNSYIAFIVSDFKDGKIGELEYNIHKYRQIEIEGQKTMLLCFYTERGYDDNIPKFLTSIKEKTSMLKDELEKFNPEIVLSSKAKKKFKRK